MAGFTVSQSEDMNAYQQQSKMTYHSDGTAIEMRFTMFLETVKKP